jgi:glucose-6-phosphate isomerase
MPHSFLIDPFVGLIHDVTPAIFRLSDLSGCFADPQAYQLALQKEDALVYQVSSIWGFPGAGQLGLGLGVLQPGKIGDEYFMTKGHWHRWPQAAEIYLGVSGEGLLQMEDIRTQETKVARILANTVAYVPEFCAHRIVNTGSEPLIYYGIYPADAGKVYDQILGRGFSKMVCEIDGQAVVRERLVTKHEKSLDA